MKFILKIILVVAASYFLLQEFSWWVIIIISFLVSVIIKTNWSIAFASSFLGVATLWFYEAYQIDSETQSILTNKIAELLTVNDALLLILITSMVGGLAAGMGGLTGHTFLKLFEKKKSRYY